MLILITKGNKLTIQANVDPGKDQQIESKKWYIDNILQDNDTLTLIVDTSTLSIGKHIIKLDVTNDCGSVGTLSADILVEDENMIEIYTKQEIDDMMASINLKLVGLDDRIRVLESKIIVPQNLKDAVKSVSDIVNTL